MPAWGTLRSGGGSQRWARWQGCGAPLARSAALLAPRCRVRRRRSGQGRPRPRWPRTKLVQPAPLALELVGGEVPIAGQEGHEHVAAGRGEGGERHRLPSHHHQRHQGRVDLGLHHGNLAVIQVEAGGADEACGAGARGGKAAGAAAAALSPGGLGARHPAGPELACWTCPNPPPALVLLVGRHQQRLPGIAEYGLPAPPGPNRPSQAIHDSTKLQGIAGTPGVPGTAPQRFATHAPAPRSRSTLRTLPCAPLSPLGIGATPHALGNAGPAGPGTRGVAHRAGRRGGGALAAPGPRNWAGVGQPGWDKPRIEGGWYRPHPLHGCTPRDSFASHAWG